jgi:tetratricopeptide (TPR) repeat protein
MVSTMIERHYDEEALISLLDSNRAGSDTHLLSCTDCTDKLESFRMIADAMHDRDVWDAREVRTQAIPATIATLRAFADRMADEDSAAETLLTELLAGDRETWLARLAHHPEWRTAGVVRKLIDAASRAIDTMPPDAVEMTTLATNIAEHLDPAASPSDTIARLRGQAWRERAYALYYTGRFSEAEAAVLASERHFCDCRVAEYDVARLEIVRALVLRALERFDEAEQAAANSADAFAPFQDLQRIASAGITRVHLLFSRNDFAGAEIVLLQLAEVLERSALLDTHARVLANLGYCYRKLERFDAAVQHHDLATSIFDELNVPTEAARNRWNAAVIVVLAGRHSDACQRLERVQNDFDRLGMMSEAALAGLDRAELLLAEGRYADVELICRRAMIAFEQAGLAHSARVLTALAFMHEAAQHRTADQALARKVKEYIRRAPAEPQLIFAVAPA